MREYEVQLVELWRRWVVVRAPSAIRAAELAEAGEYDAEIADSFEFDQVIGTKVSEYRGEQP